MISSSTTRSEPGTDPAAADAQSRALWLKRLTPDDVTAAMKRDPRLIIPLGTCEQHGPHLPMGAATIIAEALADDLSAEFGVLRAPTLEYGVNIGTEREVPGNSSVRRKTLHRMLNDLLNSWECNGFQEFILITAHDHDPHQEAVATVVTTTARIRVVDVFAVPIQDLLEGQPGHMHGGEADTSLLLYLAPDLVRMERARDYMLPRDLLRRYRRGALRVPMEGAGAIGRPTLATAAKGRAIYERIRSRIAGRVFVAPNDDD
jgi:creatinine amidohydrolase